MNKLKVLSALLVSVGMYATTTLSGVADTPGFTTTDTNPALPGDYGLNALVFTITAPITVDALGFYADALGGTDSPIVDLYSVVTTGTTTVATQLATTGVVPLSSTTGNQFNYVSITPVTLVAGTYMVAGGLYYTPDYASTTPASDILSESFYKTSSDFFGSGDSNHFDPNGYAALSVGTGGTSVEDFTLTPGTAEGVDFEYNAVVSSPEPSTYVLFGAGALLLLVVTQRRRAMQS